MKQTDWVKQRNTRKRVAKLLAAPVSRKIGGRQWILPGGRQVSCVAGVLGEGVCWFVWRMHCLGATAYGRWELVPRPVMRVFFEQAARDNQP